MTLFHDKSPPMFVLQLKSAKGDEGRKRKKIEVTASKLIHGYIKIYLRHLKDSNTKLSSELNAGLEKA